MAPAPVVLPGKSQARRSQVGCNPWGCRESGTTELLHFHFSLSCIREGNGNPLQCSCLENPKDCGAWWAAVYGVAQSWTQVKRLSSSSDWWLFHLKETEQWSCLKKKKKQNLNFLTSTNANIKRGFQISVSSITAFLHPHSVKAPI